MTVAALRKPDVVAEVIEGSEKGDATSRLNGVRVVAIIDTSIVSGPARQLVHLATGLRAHGVRLHLVTFDGPRRAPSALPPILEAAGVEHSIVLEEKRFDLSVVRRLRRTIDDIGPSVIQTHGYRPAVLAYLMKRNGLRAPWVAFSHGVTTENLKVRLYHRFDRWVSERADRIVVMSRRHARDWASVGSKVDVIYNAVIDSVDTGDLAAETVAQVRSLPRPRIGVIGRLSSEKGVDVFLEAMSIAKGRGVRISGVIAGDGPERAALEADVRNRELTDSVVLLGNVHPIAPLYRELDAIAIPSRSEGLPNVLLEACRTDTPFLATRVGGIPEIVEPNNAGVLVEPGDAAALADGLARLLEQLEETEARDGRRRIADQVSLPRRVEAHLRLYAELL